jgi:hypothetical protein
VFDLSGQRFSRECSNEKLMYLSHSSLGSALCHADGHNRNDAMIRGFGRLGKPTSQRQQPRSKPFVRRLRETFEDSCKKCSSFRVMYHWGSAEIRVFLGNKRNQVEKSAV